MDMPFSRERAIEMSSHAQLTYVAYEHGTEFVHNILKSGHPPFVQSYQTIDFLNTPRIIVKEGELVCCGYVASTINQIVILALASYLKFYVVVNQISQINPEVNHLLAKIIVFRENNYAEIRN